MIRLRHEIDRALGNRWLGPIILLVLVGLLALVVLHVTIDQAIEASVVCLALVIVFVRVVRPIRLRLLGLQTPPAASRGPPVRSFRRPVVASAFVAPLPLRL